MRHLFSSAARSVSACIKLAAHSAACVKHCLFLDDPYSYRKGDHVTSISVFVRADIGLRTHEHVLY